MAGHRDPARGPPAHHVGDPRELGGRRVADGGAVEVEQHVALQVDPMMDSSFDYLDAPIKTVAAGNTVIPFSPPLEDAMLPSEEKIIAAAREVLR